MRIFTILWAGELNLILRPNIGFGNLWLSLYWFRLFLAFPPYTLLLGHLSEHGMKLDAWVFIQNQSHDLFHPKDMDYDVRRENMIFRWVLPVLSFLTGHNIIVIVLLQSILGVLFIYKVAQWIYAVSK